MALFNDARIEWDSTTYSDQFQSINLDYGAEELDDTVFGDDTRSTEGGLKTWSVSGDALADETAGGNTVDFFADVGGTAATLSIRPTSAAIGTDNPEYSGSAVLMSMTPVAGSVGDQQINSVSWSAAGTLARNTS